jgi:putative redox protein
MIQAKAANSQFLTELTNGRQVIHSDVLVDKGGEDAGFGPHELLEAALASCIQITLKMGALKYGFDLGQTSCQVSLDRSVPERTVFVYQLNLDPGLTEEQQAHVRRFASRCPVRKTLSAEIGFVERASLPT